MNGGQAMCLGRRRIVEILQYVFSGIEREYAYFPNVYSYEVDYDQLEELYKNEFAGFPNDYGHIDVELAAGFAKLLFRKLTTESPLDRGIFTEGYINALWIIYMLRASEDSVYRFTHCIFSYLSEARQQILSTLFAHFDVLITQQQDYSIFYVFGPLIFQPTKKNSQSVNHGNLLEMLYTDLKRELDDSEVHNLAGISDMNAVEETTNNEANV